MIAANKVKPTARRLRTGCQMQAARIRPRFDASGVIPRRKHRELSRSITIVAVLVVVSCLAQLASAQESSSVSGAVFTNPGARSIALGGAFAAIADDATAAFSNPAGLIQIVRPEISAELRATGSDGPYSGDINVDGGVSGLGFFSFVYPFQKWAFAAYSHNLGSLDFTFDAGSPVTREFTIRSFAGAGAIQLSEKLSIGAGISYFLGDRSAGAAEISDTDWGFNAGVLWSPSRSWDLAGFYRQGPSFDAQDRPARLTFPDEYGLGVAFQPGAGAFTIAFEWDRVGSAADPYLDENTVTDGGSEFHLGVEYAVLKWKPVVAFRTGVWREPGRSQDLFIGPVPIGSISIEARTHFAFGFGLAFKRFQIDVGGDLTDRTAIGSISIVYSF